MLSQVLLLPPGLLGEVAATASGNGGQTSRCHPLGDQAGACHGSPPAGFLSDWGDTLCGFLMNLGSQASVQPSAGRWQVLFVCLPVWLHGLALGWSDLDARRQSPGSHLRQPTPNFIPHSELRPKAGLPPLARGSAAGCQVRLFMRRLQLGPRPAPQAG